AHDVHGASFLAEGVVFPPPSGIAPVAGDGRGVHNVTAVAQMHGDLVPARAVMPSAVDEHECEHRPSCPRIARRKTRVNALMPRASTSFVPQAETWMAAELGHARVPYC